MNNHDKRDNTSKVLSVQRQIPSKNQDLVYADLIKLKESKFGTGF